MKTLPTKIGFVLFVSLGIFLSSHVQAQENEDAAEKLKPRISASFLRQTDGNAIVNVRVSHKEGKQNIYPLGTEVWLYLFEENPDYLISKESTDEEGEIHFQLNELFKKLDDTASNYSFTIVLPESDVYYKKSKSIAIQEAKLSVELIEEDSINYVKATLVQDSLGSIKPVADAEVKFYVQRMFSLLPFGGSYTYTDESGEVLVEFPGDMPGDEMGKLTLVVKLLDHEYFGTLEQIREAEWGIPLEPNHFFNERNLWSSASNAPLSLIIISCTIILGIWGTIFYLVRLLFKIKKIGNN